MLTRHDRITAAAADPLVSRTSHVGIGRSFQQATLFPELPLIDAVKMSLEADEPTETVPSLLALPPSWDNERAKQAEAERARRAKSPCDGAGPAESTRGCPAPDVETPGDRSACQ